MYSVTRMGAATVAAIVAGVATGDSFGAFISWTTPVSGSWNDPARWSGGVPGVNDVANFGGAGGANPFTVQLASDWSIKMLNVGNQKPVLAAGGTLTVSDQVWVGAGGGNASLRLSQGHIVCSGNLAVGTDTGIGTFSVTAGADATVAGMFVGSGNPSSNGSIVVSGSGSTLSKTQCCDPTVGGGPNNTGSLTIDNGGAVSLDFGFVGIGREGGHGTLTLASGGTLVIDHGSLGIGSGQSGATPGIGNAVVSGGSSISLVANGNLTVGSFGGIGTLSMTDGAMISIGLGEFFVGLGGSPSSQSSGQLTVSASSLAARTLQLGSLNGTAVTTISDGAAVVLTGDMRFDHGTTQLLSGATVTAANVTVAYGGAASLTLGGGAVTHCAAFQCSPLAALTIATAGGVDPAIDVNGTAALDGTFVVSVERGSRIAPGESVPLIEAASFTGAFDSTTVPAGYQLLQTPTAIVLTRLDKVVGLTISPSTISVVQGFTGQASAMANFAGGSQSDVTTLATWTSGNPALLSVSPSGALVGLATGTTTLTASYNGFSAQVSATVGSPAVETGCELVTITQAGVQMEDPAAPTFPFVSGDGRYVLFVSTSDVLVGPTPAPVDLLIKDLETGALEVASVNTAGDLANSSVAVERFSSDARFVTFSSYATNLVIPSPNFVEVYLRDRQTGITERVSVAADGGIANGDSYYTDVSDDGRYVAFTSTASNLVSPPQGNGLLQLFVRDRLLQTTTLISAAGGALANGNASNISISSDGRFIAFDSTASNLVPDDTNGFDDVFVADRITGAIERVSVTDDEAQAVGGVSQYGALSDDGNRVFFYSFANNLVAAHNGQRHAYLRDRAAGTTRIITVDENGQQSVGSTGSLSISGDGKYVAFRTGGSLVAADVNASDDVYRVQVDDGTIDLVSVSLLDGLASGGSSYTALDADGSTVIFRSESSSLVGFDTNGFADYFVRPMPVRVTGDLDGDGAVNGADLATLLGAWGEAGSGDLDGDGVVGGADLAILLGSWTP